MAITESEKTIAILIIGNNISFSIKGRDILENVHIRIPENKIVGLAGTNGAGKSSLLKILIGQQKQFDGNVYYNDVSINQYKPIDLAKVRAVLPQESSNTFPVLAMDVVQLGRLFFNENESKKRAIEKEVVTYLKAGHLMHQYYDTLSGGEKQRVQIARVLCQIWEGEATRFLFLDEPISSLDVALQHDILELLQHVKSKNIGVLIILHDLNLLLQYCDEACFLKKGKCIVQDDIAAVCDERLLSEVYDFNMKIQQVDGQPYVLPIQQSNSKLIQLKI